MSSLQTYTSNKTIGKYSTSRKIPITFGESNKETNELAYSIKQKLQTQEGDIYLNLSECNIGDDKCHLIVNHLSHNKQIREIFLRNNQISSKGLGILSEIFNNPNFIQVLNLSWNSIGNSDVKEFQELCASLALNQSLQVLELRNNKIDDKGAIAIAKMIITNMGLQKIDLRRNLITDEGASQILTSLKANITLQQIELEGNLISQQNIDLIQQSLQQRKFFQSTFSKNITSKPEVTDMNYTLQNQYELIEQNDKKVKANTSQSEKLQKISKTKELENLFETEKTQNNEKVRSLIQDVEDVRNKRNFVEKNLTELKETIMTNEEIVLKRKEELKVEICKQQFENQELQNEIQKIKIQMQRVEKELEQKASEIKLKLMEQQKNHANLEDEVRMQTRKVISEQRALINNKNNE